MKSSFVVEMADRSKFIPLEADAGIDEKSHAQLPQCTPRQHPQARGEYSGYFHPLSGSYSKNERGLAGQET